MSKCSKCYSNDVNEKKGNSKLTYWFFGLIFFLLAIDILIEKKGLDTAGFSLGIGVLLFYLGKRRVVYNYYCNNCRNKWSKGEWD